MSTDTPTPESESSGGHRATGSSSAVANIPGGMPAIIAVVLLLVVGVAAYFLLGRDGKSDAEGSDCFVDTIRLTTAASLRPMVDKGVEAIEDEDPCLDIEVTDGSVNDVIALFKDSNAKIPDLWIPDSPTWSSPLQKAGYKGTEISTSLAESPVGLVSGPSVSSPASWYDTLQSGKLTTSNPNTDGASALALLAPFAEAKKTGESKTSILEAFVPVAQAYGERMQNDDGGVDPAKVTATSSQLIPMTERDFVMARRANDQLTMVAPDTGVPVLRLPLVSVAKANLDPLSKSGEGKGARTGRALAHWFASAPGREAVAEGDFRVPGADSIGSDVGLGNARSLKAVDPAVADEALRSWETSAYPSSMLVVVDVSGSMQSEVGGRSRISLTAEAAEVALDRLPEQARIGLWMFSIDQGGKGVDYKVLSPLKALNSKTGDTSHKEYLRRQIPIIERSTRGGTGLYDTTFAAYKQAMKDFDSAWFNSVVILTDGANDDPGSMSEAELIESIEGIRDPVNKPVRIIPVGIGPDADMKSLQRIAEATDSQAYLAENPMNILVVLAQAVMSR
ncbi:MAG: substrate-binding domain-containing protein [Nocardioides sp.]|uniref:substrate-binding domain-containing protein n=1 Tax=Nocardioides sp. TaxID=35761 RepID=UPI003F00CF6E